MLLSIFGGEDHELSRGLSPISCALGWISRLCTCFTFQLFVDRQILWLCACLRFCSSLLPLLPPSFMVWICGFYKYSGWYYCFHWFVSMTVPGGGCSRGCHGYHHALLESGIAPPRYLPQAHLLVINEFTVTLYITVPTHVQYILVPRAIMQITVCYICSLLSVNWVQ